MRELSNKEIVALIRERNINFIGMGTSQWHLIGVKAAYWHLKSKGVDVRPLIIFHHHMKNGVLIKEDSEIDTYIIKLYQPHPNIFKYFAFLLKCLFAKSVENPDFYLCAPWMSNMIGLYEYLPRHSHTFKFMVTEEGAGQYNKEFFRYRDALKMSNKLLMCQKIVDIFFSSIYRRNGVQVDFTPFVYHQGSLVYNRESCEAYKNALKCNPVELDDNKVLILLQDDYLVEMEAAISVGNSLLDKGYKVCVKAHPRYPIPDEIKLNSQMEVITAKLAIEKLYEEVRAKYVISFSSTALMSLSYLYGAKTISICKLVEQEKINDKYKEVYKWVAETFGNIISIPSNENELYYMLKNGI